MLIFLSLLSLASLIASIGYAQMLYHRLCSLELALSYVQRESKYELVSRIAEDAVAYARQQKKRMEKEQPNVKWLPHNQLDSAFGFAVHQLKLADLQLTVEAQDALRQLIEAHVSYSDGRSKRQPKDRKARGEPPKPLSLPQAIGQAAINIVAMQHMKP